MSQLALWEQQETRHERRDQEDGFGKLWTWANNPDPAYCADAAADVLRLWRKYAAAQRELKTLRSEAELAANRKKAARTLATDYGDKLREAQDKIARLEGKLAAANMPLRVALAAFALAGLLITLSVVL